MGWKKSPRNQALLLILVVVPVLMFGLGASGFLIARAAGLGNNSIWIALVLSTVGFVISIMITLRAGRRYENLSTQQKNDPVSGQYSRN